MSRCGPTIRMVLYAASVTVLCLAASVHADTLGSIAASTDAQNLTVGDPFWYHVALQMPGDSRPLLPGADAEFPDFEVRDYHEETTSLADGTQQVLLRYQLVCFTAGDKQIDDFEVEAERLVEGRLRTDKYLAPPVTVTVHSVLPPQGGDPKPIYGPLFLAPWWYSWLKPVLIALALLTALVVAVWLWHRRSRRKQAAPEVELTAHEKACLALQMLGDKGLIAAGNLKAFYSELGDIMRRWLEWRADIRAMELTTGLIRHDLRGSDLDADWQQDFVDQLRRADLVKFARWTPEDAVARRDLELAAQLLQRGAKPEPEPEATAGVETDKGAAA